MKKNTSHPPIPKARFLRSLRGQDHVNQLLSVAKEYGSFVKMSRTLPQYLIADPDLVHHILVSERDTYIKGRFFFERLGALLGQGLLTNLNDSWRAQRRFLQKAFQRDCMPGYAEKTITATQRYLESWDTIRTPVNMNIEMLSLTATAAAETLFSETLSLDKARELSRLSTEGQRGIMTSFFLQRFVPTPKNIRFQRALSQLNRYTTELIDKRRGKASKEHDLLSLLLEGDAELLSEQLMLDEAKTFLVAGHETTGAALAWAWHLLCQNPACYERLSTEVRSVLGDKPLCYDDLARLPYCRQVFDETLRLYTPIWGFPRSSVKSDVLSGYALPAESHFVLSPYVVHRLEDYWDDPDTFRPERFASNNQKHAKHAYIPFGGGPHICIASQLALMQAQIMLAMIVQRFDVHAGAGFVHEMPLELYVTLRPEKPVWVDLSPV